MAAGAVTLPPGVTISASRETSQAGPSGNVIQGMVFSLNLPSGAVTTVFVPYALMTNTDAVSQLFAERVAGINNITNLGG